MTSRHIDLVRTAMTSDERLDDLARVRIWNALADTLASDHESSPLAHAGRRRRTIVLAAGTGLAAAALAAAIAVVVLRRAPSPRLATVAADTTLTLPLGPHTRAAVVGPARFELVGAAATATTVRVDAGVLLAEFSGGPGRSLRIVAPDVTVDVVGTLFAVDVGVNQTCVSVEHGAVRVTPRGRAAFALTGGRAYCTQSGSQPLAPATRDALLRHERVITASLSPPTEGTASLPTESTASPTSADPAAQPSRAQASAPAPALAPAAASTRAPAVAPAAASTRAPAVAPAASTRAPAVAPAPAFDAPAPVRARAPAPTRVPAAAPDPALAPGAALAPASARSRASSVPDAATPATAPVPAVVAAPAGVAVPAPAAGASAAAVPAPAAVRAPVAVPAPAAGPVPPRAASPGVGVGGSASTTAAAVAAPAPALRPDPASRPSLAGPDQLYREAEAALARDPRAADRVLAQLVAQHPQSALVEQALYDRARIAYQQRSWAAARSHLDQLLSLPSSRLGEQARFLACRIAVVTQDQGAAACLDGYRRAYPRSPHVTDVLGMLVQLEHAAGGCRAAAVRIAELVQLHPASKLAVAWRARCPLPSAEAR